SQNTTCVNPTLAHHYYLISQSPFTGAATGLQDEPTLSHPHNIFLHVWVSMDLFGLLAFIAILALFFWLFVRILIPLYKRRIGRDSPMWWMIISVGAAMCAGVIHGQVDS